MPSSMTGFARSEHQYPWGTLIWELRSVNHRYLEIHLRLPEQLRELETALRERSRQRLQRGKLEITLHYKPEESDGKIGLDEERLAQVADACARIRAHMPEAASVDPLELLRWPGVQQVSSLPAETLNQAALDGFDTALAQLEAHRRREGAELGGFIEQRLTTLAEEVESVRQRLPEILAAQRQKLQDKIASLQVELDPERLEQEVVLIAQKADVDEELDRLGAHIAEVRHTLKQSSAIGRRLDFLMQELNREVNTLSSKSIVADTTQAAVNLKVLIEQMREQVQNIE